MAAAVKRRCKELQKQGIVPIVRGLSPGGVPVWQYPAWVQRWAEPGWNGDIRPPELSLPGSLPGPAHQPTQTMESVAPASQHQNRQPPNLHAGSDPVSGPAPRPTPTLQTPAEHCIRHLGREVDAKQTLSVLQPQQQSAFHRPASQPTTQPTQERSDRSPSPFPPPQTPQPMPNLQPSVSPQTPAAALPGRRTPIFELPASTASAHVVGVHGVLGHYGLDTASEPVHATHGHGNRTSDYSAHAAAGPPSFASLSLPLHGSRLLFCWPPLPFPGR